MTKTNLTRRFAAGLATAALIVAPAVAVLATTGAPGTAQAAPQQGGIGGGIDCHRVQPGLAGSCPIQQGGIG